MAKAHARLSASGAHRWIACPASVTLEEQFPTSTSSYAEEGTLAHALAELKISKVYAKMRKSTYEKAFAEIAKNEMFSASMEGYVDDFVGYVQERMNAAGKSAEIFIEAKLDLSRYVPDSFGTGDVVIVTPDYIEVIDLKYGKGVAVSAEENAQLRLYGLGAYDAHGFIYDLEKVIMTIYQPRIDNISTEEIPASDLIRWAEEVVAPAAVKAEAGEGEPSAGSHCQFCRAKGACRARAEKNLELAAHDFEDPPLLSTEEIADVLFKAEELSKWCADIKNYALEQARDHEVSYPGWKLVEGRSNRKYSDEGKVAGVLTDAGYVDEQIYERSLLGITKMEKLLGKEFKNVLGEFVVKPAGAPTLAPASDKRVAIGSAASAAEDFKED